MKNRKSSTALFMALTLLPASFMVAGETAISPQTAVEVRLDLEPDDALPGVPVEFRMTVTNRSENAVTVPGQIRLHVQPEQGEAFLAKYTFSEQAPTLSSWPGGLGEAFRLSPGETRVFHDPIDVTLMSPGWFWDERLNSPGKYRLQVITDSDPPELKHWALNLTASADLVKEPIASTAVVFTVRMPEGEDAKVWNMMQSVAKGHWSASHFGSNGFYVAFQVWRKFPASRYLHDFGTLIALDDRTEKVRALQTAIAIDPEGPWADQLRLALGAHYSNMAREASYVHGGDVEKAEALARKSRDVLVPLSRTAKKPSMRMEAERATGRVPDRMELLKIQASWARQ